MALLVTACVTSLAIGLLIGIRWGGHPGGHRTGATTQPLQLRAAAPRPPTTYAPRHLRDAA